MSKNFELLQSLSRGSEVFQVERPVAAAVALSPAIVWEKPATTTTAPVVTQANEETLTEVAKIGQRILGLKNGGKTVVGFAGIDDDTGAASICAEVGEALCGQAPGTVCVIDANLRGSALLTRFGLKTREGLLDVAESGKPIDSVACRIGDRGLFFVPAGVSQRRRGNPQLSEQAARTIASATQYFNYVLVCTACCNLSTDILTVGRNCDGVVLVIEANTTRKETARRVADSIRSANVPLLGAILNNCSHPIPAAVYKHL